MMGKKFSDLKYERPDFGHSANIYQELIRQMRKIVPNSKTVKQCFDQFSADYINFISMRNLCSILRYTSEDNDYYDSEFEYLAEKTSEMQAAYNEVFSTIAGLDLRFEQDTLEHSSIINQARRVALTYGRISKQLIDRENDLIQKNRDHLRNISIKIKAVEPGKFQNYGDQELAVFQIHIEELYNWFRQADAGTRAKIYFNFSQILEQNSSEREKAFHELVELRKNQMEQTGMSYFNLVTSGTKGYGYSRQQLVTFKKNLNEYFIPLIEEIIKLRNDRLHIENPMFYDEFQLLPEGHLNLFNDQISIRDTFTKALKDILGDEGIFIDNLIRGNFWTSDPRLKRELERDITLLPKWDSVFLALSFSRPGFILENDFYSIGKALADLSGIINLKGLATFEQTDIVRKIAGLSMMFLSSRKMKLFTEENSELYNDLILSYELLKIPFEIALDTFESTVYFANTGLNLTFSDIWKQIEQNNNLNFNFGSDGFFSEGNGWQMFQRLYDKPFSSLNKVLALVVVLAERPHQDRRNRLETKLNKLLTSNTDLPFTKRLRASGFSSPFEIDTIRKASFAVCDMLRL